MEVDLTIDGVPYRPLPTQALFHASEARSRAFLGGWGAGKTGAAAIEGVLQSLEHEDGRGAMGMITRYNWHELLSTTWPQFIAVIPEPIRRLCVIKEGGGSRVPSCVFPNGFHVVGFNLKNHKQLGSFNLSWAWIDEVSEDGVDESSYLQLRGRLRNKKGRRSLWLTGNPEGRNWVWQRFFAAKEDSGARLYAGHEGWMAPTTENIHLPADYHDDVLEVLPEDWRQRYLEGSFDIFQGRIVTEWDPRIHWVPAFPMAAAWPRYRGVDHGINHPSACLWLARDIDRNRIFYREYEKRNVSPAGHAAEILAQSFNEEDMIQWTVIDPAARERQTAGGVIQRIIHQYREAGLHCIEGDNDVRASIVLIKSLLQPDPKHRFPNWHPRAGELGSPWMFVTDDCPRFKWELENWRWKDVRPGGVDREKPLAVNDDLVACARYLLMNSPHEAAAPPGPVNEHQAIIDLCNEIRAERESRVREELIGHERLAAR